MSAQGLPARSLCIDVAQDAIDADVRLLVLAGGLTKREFDRTIHGITRAVAAKAADAVRALIEGGAS